MMTTCYCSNPKLEKLISSVRRLILQKKLRNVHLTKDQYSIWRAAVDEYAKRSHAEKPAQIFFEGVKITEMPY
jgi:hypothetical protein